MKVSWSTFKILFSVSLGILVLLGIDDYAKANDEDMFKLVDKSDFWDTPMPVKFSAIMGHKVINVGNWRKWDQNFREYILCAITGSLYARFDEQLKSEIKLKPNDKMAKEMHRLWYLYCSQKLIINHLVAHVDSIIYDKELSETYPIIDIVHSYMWKKYAEYVVAYDSWSALPDELKKSLEKRK